MNIRIGHGVDVHAFGAGDHLMLGGLRVAHDRGVLAHSDGDVLIHALCDALLGALAMGDIGQWFPPSDERYRNADSSEFLRRVMTMVASRGYQLGNADITVIAESPKIGPHRDGIRQSLAAIIGCHVDRISVKATTTEKLGFCGRGEGIAVEAVVLLQTLAPRSAATTDSWPA